MTNLILTDIDGVVLNWEYAFHTWMGGKGYARAKEAVTDNYDMSAQYGMTKPVLDDIIRHFNASAAIGFLPPLRDAIHYMRKLHEQQGYVFHAITSLSKDPSAQELRTQNLRKMFGSTMFERFVYLDTAADKTEALLQYKDSGLMWVEDNEKNAELGVEMGLNSLLMEHFHNMNNTKVPLVKNWKQIYDIVTGDA